MCRSNDHNYNTVKDEHGRVLGYYKQTNGEYDNTKCFAQIFCSKCGEQKEIIIRDAKENPNAVARSSVRIQTKKGKK